MLRRELLIGGAAASLAAPAWADAPSLQSAARDAFIYTLPMVEVARVRARLLGAGLPAGRFFGQGALATPEARTVTTPNNDTIYATAFIDLTAGPATIIVPPLGGRYASFAIMDMVSDNVAVLGTRTTGQDGGVFTLVGPAAAAGADAIRSPTPWVWALARVLVAGPEDLPAAQALLARFKVAAAPAGRPAPGADRNGPWQAYFKAANALLLENPPPATDRGMLRRIAPLGLGAPMMWDPARTTAQDAAAIAAGVDEARQLLRSAGFGGKQVGGWIFRASDSGAFFQDYLGRARVAVGGLAALPPPEAMYLTAVPPGGGRQFDGDGLWRLRFAKGMTPPVDAFWSLTMYEAAPEGGFYLTRNPINRYAIGDRTPGLTRGADGSLEILISRTDPGGARSANWLPAPAGGPFTMILRAYLPRPELISQGYTPPTIEKI
jgi:hypothetical protein